MASLIDEGANEQPLGNGYYGSSSSGSLPKYKKRNVSATRTFPPKCGPNAEPISSEALLDVIVKFDDHAVPGGHANSVQYGIGVEAPPRGLEENRSVACGIEASVDNEFQENVVVQLPDPVAAAVEDYGVDTKSKIETGLCDARKSPDGSETDDLGLPKSLVDVAVLHGDSNHAVSEPNNTVKSESHVDKVDGTKSTSAMEVEIHEAVESPNFLEQSVSMDELVGDAVAMVMGSMGNDAKGTALDVKPSRIELPRDIEGSRTDHVNEVNRKDAEGKSITGDEVEPISEIKELAVKEIPVTDRTFRTLQEKVRRRKVAVKRDFPPHCGKNAPPLTEEERKKIFYETESSFGSKMECSRDELKSPKEVLERGKLKKILSAKVEESSLVKEMDSDVKENEGYPTVIVSALMAAQNCPWVHENATVTSDDRKIEGRVAIQKPTRKEKGKVVVVAKKTIPKTGMQENSSIKKPKHSLSAQKDAVGTSHAVVVRDEGDSGQVEEGLEEDSLTVRKNNFTVNFPPFGASSNHSDARNKVRETLRLYQTICRKLLQGEEARSVKTEKPKRIDLEAAKILKEKGVDVSADKNPVGPVPGVEVGDEFLYRVEMAIVGVHRLYQGGIDYVKQNGMIIAASVVASGGYSDGWDNNADVLIYCGQGGNVIGKKQPEDQKLERGNLALANSASTKNPVRVVRGSKEAKASDSQDSKSKMVVTYVYDGLYTVEKYWQEPGPHGKLVYMFELRRIPGQPELAVNKLKNAKRETREGVCLPDICRGKELIPICAVNTIDNEKPPPFTYIRKMKYPKGLHLSPPQGCNCSTKCSESRKCPCILRNGGELPYNRNGAIVEVKPTVYECGPSCKCPSSCYNRVSQHGIKIQLEVFKTENRGWGVRSLASISSGSFICEYVGELLEDKEAEQRAGSDEYLFDIGKNSIEHSSINSADEEDGTKASLECGYTVDAAQFGNVGRFINHSCSPNLYAQDVLYDHDDKRMPHVMFFAAENIPPLQELTYDYNYTVNQVRDSHGNIKMKTCYCGSAECSGRMY